ncbi:hypothetical protein ScPMuIL_005013 [Solemya velum]
MWLILIGVATLLLEIAGLVSPGWIRLKFDEFSMDFGLFYLCLSGSCASYDSLMNSVDSGAAALHLGFLEFQIESILAALFALIGVILSWTSNRAMANNTKNKQIGAAVCFCISGICAWIPTGKLAQVHSYIGILAPIEVPYSIVMMGIAGVLAFIAALIALVTSCKNNQPQTAGMVLQPMPMEMQGAASHAHSGYPAQGYPAQGYPAQGYPYAGQQFTPPPKY